MTNSSGYEEPVAPEAVQESRFWHGLGFQVTIGMLVGVAIGFLWPEFARELKLLGDIFLRLIKSAVAPLTFLMITQGVTAAGSSKKVGRVGLTAVIYFECISFLALCFGMLFARMSGVGRGFPLPASHADSGSASLESMQESAHAVPGFHDFVLNVFPENFVGALAKGELLQVAVLGLFVGFGLLRLDAKTREPITRGLQALSALFFQVIHIVMRLAPIGALGAIAFVVGSSGTTALAALAYMVSMYYIACMLFVAIVFGAVSLLMRFSLSNLVKFVMDELIVVFGTSSSESVLPRLLEKLPAYGISKQTVALVLPTGYAFNADGAALFMTFSFVFLANAYQVPMTWHQQLGVLLVMALTSKGIASVTGGAFVALTATVAGTHILPIESTVLVFGVYRFLSMAACVCNIIGHAVATLTIAKMCGEYSPTPAVTPALGRQY
jgi:aerobic C4-dicarboxylate transport protein